MLVLIADTIALFINWTTGSFYFKILLMPLLLVGLLFNKKNTLEKNWRLILFGVIAAWLGDILLLFSGEAEGFFIAGLACFLGTHLTYVLYFYQYNKGRTRWFRKNPVLTFLVIFFSVSMLAFLLPSLGDLVMPVAFYILVITIMMLQVLSAKPFLPKLVKHLFVAGALLFMLSDSMLAIAKFNTPFLFSEPSIIFTYGLAQLFIVSGTILNADKPIPTG